MRAVTMAGFGESLETSELPVPEPGADEVRVKVRAASVNGFDLAVAAGYTKDFMEHRFPVVLGKDFAGEVDAVGAEVKEFAVGDRVFGTVTKPYLGDGSYAEFVTVPTSVGLARIPDDVSFEEAAALGLAGSAAYGVVDGLAIQPGQTVLVTGATGGVGNLVVQLVSAAGARVIATAHTDAEQALVRRLGAHDVVDHTGDLAAQVANAAPDGIDAVAHLAGDTSSVELVRDGGRFTSTLVQSPDQVPSQTVTVVPVYANPTPEVLGQLADNQASGRVTVTVQQTFSLDRVQDALDAFAKGTLGKIVITIP